MAAEEDKAKGQALICQTFEQVRRYEGDMKVVNVLEVSVCSGGAHPLPILGKMINLVSCF